MGVLPTIAAAIQSFKMGTTSSPRSMGSAPPGQKSFWTSTMMSASPDFSSLGLAFMASPFVCVSILPNRLAIRGNVRWFRG